MQKLRFDDVLKRDRYLTDVLYHALGFLKQVLDPFEKQELVQLIEDYRKGFGPADRRMMRSRPSGKG